MGMHPVNVSPFTRFEKESRKKLREIYRIYAYIREGLICILQGHNKAAVAQETHSSSLAGPGFPRGGDTNPPVEMPTYNFVNIFPKTARN